MKVKPSIEPMPPFVEKWVKENKQFLFRQPKMPSRFAWFVIGFMIALGLACWFFVANEKYLYKHNYVIQKNHATWWCLNQEYIK